MNHSFQPSALNTKLCAKCDRPPAHHQAFYACESCGSFAMVYKSGELDIDTNELEMISDKILACKKCKAKEDEAIEFRSLQPKPVTYTAVSPQAIEQMNNARAESFESVNAKYARELDLSIARITDLFNAKTVSIMELKAIVDADDSIAKENKHTELFKMLGERIEHLKPLMREARSVLQNLGNEQQSLQSYMANMANKVRADVRAKYNIADISYEIKAPPKKVTTPKKGLNKEDVKYQAARVQKEIGIPIAQAMAIIEMTCKARNISPDKAANELCRNTKEITSESSSE